MPLMKNHETLFCTTLVIQQFLLRSLCIQTSLCRELSSSSVHCTEEPQFALTSNETISLCLSHFVFLPVYFGIHQRQDFWIKCERICNFARINSREVIRHLISAMAGLPSSLCNYCASSGCSCYLFFHLELLNQPLKGILTVQFLAIGLHLHYFVLFVTIQYLKKMAYQISEEEIDFNKQCWNNWIAIWKYKIRFVPHIIHKNKFQIQNKF